MDLASLIGLIGAVGMIVAAMIAGGGVAPFIDTQSILIVFGVLFCCNVLKPAGFFRQFWRNGKSFHA